MLLFPRAPDGTIDLVNGKYRRSKPINMKVKYEKEIRFALGVAMIKRSDGLVSGQWLPDFYYKGKTIIPHSDWERKVRDEINRVKNLKQKGRWCKTSRTGLYEEDVISSGMIKDIAEAKRKKLELAGVTKLLQLKQLTENLAAIKSLASILPGVGLKSLQN